MAGDLSSRGVVIGAHPSAGPCAQQGVGMFEFLVALLIFSLGMMGLMSAQLAGKRAGFDASQRSTATALARDILERVRANPGQIESYQVVGAGDESRRQPLPGADCDIAACTAPQLAAFDLWQWESLLLGESEQSGGESAGGLVSPRGCLRRDGGTVTVTISWQGLAPDAPVAAAATACDSENPEPIAPEDAGIETTRRHQLAIATFVAE